MGTEEIKCKCGCKEENLTENFGNMNNKEYSNNENDANKDPINIFNNSSSSVENKDNINPLSLHNNLRNFVRNKNIRSRRNSIKKNEQPSIFKNFSLGNFSLKNNDTINDINTYKIVKIQSKFRGYKYRKEYHKIKISLIENTNKLYNSLTEKYSKPNLRRAEAFYDSDFDKEGWKEFYSSENTDKETLKKLFNYDYGKILKTSLSISLYNHIPSVYIGEVNYANDRHGFGVLLKGDGSKYEGRWRFNIFTGWGRFIGVDGTLYEGYFMDGKLNGKGIKQTFNDIIYKGDFINNLKEGKGKEETREYIYEGEFKNDKKNGIGKIKYILLNDLYEGEFKDDKITGKGEYLWGNKDKYKGDFINGKMHGKGYYKWPDGGEYYGDYVNNIKEGKGVFKWANGKTFEGDFHKGKPNGVGILKTGIYTLQVEYKDGILISTLRDILEREVNK